MLRRGGRDALEAAMTLQSDRLMGGAAILLAMAAPDRVACRIEVKRAPDSLGVTPSIPAQHLLSVAMLRRVGSAHWRAEITYSRLPLAALDCPRCRVCGSACRPDGCLPDRCIDVSRPAWPKGHTPCAP